MGWSSGSVVMSGIIKAAKKAIPDNDVRRVFYKKMIKVLENADCDTLDECRGKDIVFDELVPEPECFDDDDDDDA